MTVVVKLGSSIVADERGEVRGDVLDGVCAQVAELHHGGEDVAMVTSGAIALGWRLMQHLVTYARSEKLQQLHGSVLAGNSTMLQMCRELGFSIEREPGDDSVRRVVLQLDRISS